MFSNLLALKLEYAMSVYQKFRDSKTAGPFLRPCMIFARAWASHAHIAWQNSFSPSSQGPEEMCLSLEHQNPSKTSEIMGYFDRVDDRVTVSLHILYTANQETEGSQDRAVRQRGYGLRLLIFKMANNKVDWVR